MTPRITKAARLAAGLGVAFLLAGCGGTPATTANEVPASPDLTIYAKDIKFDMPTYTAKAGVVNIAYLSQGNQSHNLLITDSAGNKVGTKLTVGPGDKTGETVTLTAGIYKMVCDVPGHKQSMNAILTVA
jgi:plastocyanin